MAWVDVSTWLKYLIEHFNLSLVDFFALLKQEDGSEVMPGTLKSYVFGIQRGFKSRSNYQINVLTREAFKDPTCVVFSFIDNMIRSLQSDVRTPKGRNVLDEKEFENGMHFMHYHASIKRGFWPGSYLALLSHVPSVHYKGSLKLKHVLFTTINEENVIRIVRSKGGQRANQRIGKVDFTMLLGSQKM